MKNSIINLTDARRLLGALSARMSDDEVEKVVADFDALARAVVARLPVQKANQAFDISDKNTEDGSKCNEQ